MPNHFHLLLREVADGGVTSFMRRLGTAYTMYFNIKRDRTGNLFMRPFRSKHIKDDRYFQQVINYLHCNPAELFEPRWKSGEVKDLKSLQGTLLAYSYSSFGVYNETAHPLRPLLDKEAFGIVAKTSPKKMLREASAFYREFGKVTP